MGGGKKRSLQRRLPDQSVSISVRTVLVIVQLGRTISRHDLLSICFLVHAGDRLHYAVWVPPVPEPSPPLVCVRACDVCVSPPRPSKTRQAGGCVDMCRISTVAAAAAAAVARQRRDALATRAVKTFRTRISLDTPCTYTHTHTCMYARAFGTVEKIR